MGLIQRLIGNSELEERLIGNVPGVWPSDREYLFGNSNPSGVSVTESTALNYVSVFACVRAISEDIASMPIDVYSKQLGSTYALDCPYWLVTPNKEHTRFEFMERVLASLLLWGNAYIYVVHDDVGEILELWPLDPSKIEVRRNQSTNDIEYEVDNKATLGTDEVLHIKAFPSPSGIVGLSPITVGRSAISAGIATDTYAGTFWGNNAQPAGVISMPDDLDEDDAKRTLRIWNTTHQGARNSNKVGVLANGASYNPISIPAEDSQFLQTRVFQVAEIARLFRVPPHIIGELSHATFSNIEQQSLEYVTRSLAPWVYRVECSLNTLLPPDMYVKLNEKGLLRGDSAAQMDTLRTAFQNGWINTDEARDKLEMAPLPDGKGEQYFVPLNMRSLDDDDMTLRERIGLFTQLITVGVDANAASAITGLGLELAQETQDSINAAQMNESPDQQMPMDQPSMDTTMNKDASNA